MDQVLSDIGIISAYRFADDGTGVKIDVANLDTELADPRGWLWLHFSLSNRRCHDWLGTQAPLSAVPTRRTMIQAGAIGMMGLGLAELAAVRAASNSSPKKSIIFIFLTGGLSQHDSFDMKPDAPDSVRGEFQPIATTVPGTRSPRAFHTSVPNAGGTPARSSSALGRPPLPCPSSTRSGSVCGVGQLRLTKSGGMGQPATPFSRPYW